MNHIGPKLHDDRPRVVAFASAKGGTGKSTLCADIARGLTRHNFRVLCVDMAWSCPSLNILLGCEEPSFDIGDGRPGVGEAGSHIAEFIVDTEYASVYLASLAAARSRPFEPPAIHADEFIHQLHELDFDWVLLDLSNGTSGLDAGLFTLSDIPLVVPTPEPAAVRQTTQFLRAALFRAIGYHPDAPSLEDEILDVLYNQPLHMSASGLRYDAPSANCRAIIDETIERLETYMIVNLVREGAEHDLGFVLSHALHRELRLFPRVLASIEYADRRWFYNRRTTGTNSSRNGEGLSNEVELLTRHIRDIDLVDERYPRPIPSSDEDVHPARLMGLNPELSRNEVRQHCRRLWEGYRRENAISLVFGDPQRREVIADELEQLYRHVLTMPSESFSKDDVDDASRKFRNSRSGDAGDSASSRTGDSAASSNSPPKSSTSSTDKRDDDTTGDSPSPNTSTNGSSPDDDVDSTADGPDSSEPMPDSPGAKLAELRREQSLSLQELSSRTHIGVKYLAAIEEIDLDVLPRQVYLRGYLREIARIFDIDANELLDDYFEFLDKT